jgi:hypothetical protein
MSDFATLPRPGRSSSFLLVGFSGRLLRSGCRVGDEGGGPFFAAVGAGRGFGCGLEGGRAGASFRGAEMGTIDSSIRGGA